ncbi:PIR protein [Plasmodium ovale]|uniref:PIR protein n=1 Tax=Plasmodium ovale TaxID=36330 RepID=A0A1D3JFV2_PLAOA|nr:PIR protein [Plasmodium ovale]
MHLFTQYGDIFDINTKEYYDDHMEVCKSIGLEKFDTKFQNFLIPCTSFANYLKNIENTYEDNEKKYHCMYLNYCINNVDNRATYHGYEYKELLEAYRMVSSSMKICKENIDVIEADIFFNIRELYEFYNNFYNIKNGLITSLSDKCEIAKKCSEYYERNMEECQDKTDDGLCKVLLNFKEEYENEMEKVLSCEKAQSLNAKKSNSFDALVITPFIVTFLISLFTFILYKFTPFGYWIRHRIKKIKSRMKDIKGENQHLLNNSEMDNLYAQNKSYKIKYFTSENL